MLLRCQTEPFDKLNTGAVEVFNLMIIKTLRQAQGDNKLILILLDSLFQHICNALTHYDARI